MELAIAGLAIINLSASASALGSRGEAVPVSCIWKAVVSRYTICPLELELDRYLQELKYTIFGYIWSGRVFLLSYDSETKFK
jgi:hypothetical protein